MTREWDNYQSVNNRAEWRIENLKLKRFAGQDKTLLDLGANQGQFGIQLSKHFKHITAVEPFVPAPELPENISWFKKSFKEFITETNNTYDVVFSFATTREIRNNDKLNEDQIAKGHYDLVKPNGILIYETHILDIGQNLDMLKRIEQAKKKGTTIISSSAQTIADMREHTDKMLKAFKELFGEYIETGNGRTIGKRKYYIYAKHNR